MSSVFLNLLQKSMLLNPVKKEKREFWTVEEVAQHVYYNFFDISSLLYLI